MRHSISLLRGSLVIALLTALPSLVAAQGRVSGVVNDEDGHPIKAATVTAEFEEAGLTMTAATDDKGRFQMIGLRGGRWAFIVQAPGFSPRSGVLPIRVGGVNPPIAFTLLKLGNMTGPLGSVTAKDLQTELSAADALFGQKKWDEAIAAYRTIADKTPSLYFVNLQIASAYLNKKDYDAALAAYNEVLKADPTNEQAAIGVSMTALERGDVQTADQALTKAAQAPSAGRDTFLSLADVKMARGDVDAATMWYRKAADADPSWGKPLYKLALAALKKGDAATASTLLAKVISVDPESAEAGLAKSAIEQLKR